MKKIKIGLHFIVLILLIKLFVDKSVLEELNYELSGELDLIKKRKKTLDLYYSLLLEWIAKNNINKDLFKKLGCKNIAIYGMGLIGEALYRCLCKEGISPAYIIDKNIESYTITRYQDQVAPVKSDEVLNMKEHIDLIIVTPISKYEKIKENLEKQTDCKIMSLKELLEVD